MVKGQADKFASAIIRKAIAGEIRNKEAAARLRVTERYLRELKRDYAEKGEAALRHGNAGRAAANRTDPDTEERVAALYRTKYDGFNFRHFLELLRDEEGIRIGYATLNRILAGAGIRWRGGSGAAGASTRCGRGAPPSASCCRPTPRSTRGSEAGSSTPSTARWTTPPER